MCTLMHGKCPSMVFSMVCILLNLFSKVWTNFLLFLQITPFNLLKHGMKNVLYCKIDFLLYFGSLFLTTVIARTTIIPVCWTMTTGKSHCNEVVYGCSSHHALFVNNGLQCVRNICPVVKFSILHLQYHNHTTSCNSVTIVIDILFQFHDSPSHVC